jgi:hypothetical protein
VVASPETTYPLFAFDWVKSSDQMRFVRRKARKFSIRVYIFIHHTGGGMMGTGPWASGRGWPCCRCFRLCKDCDTHHGADWLCFVQASWICEGLPVSPLQYYLRDFRALTLGDEKVKTNRRRNAKTPQLASSNMRFTRHYRV